MRRGYRASIEPFTGQAIIIGIKAMNIARLIEALLKTPLCRRFRAKVFAVQLVPIARARRLVFAGDEAADQKREKQGVA